jgi:hypothetical protein
MSQLTVLPGCKMTAPGDRPAPLPALPSHITADQAEYFLLSLDAEMTGADLPRAAYLLGLAEGHLANLLQLIRALTAEVS